MVDVYKHTLVDIVFSFYIIKTYFISIFHKKNTETKKEGGVLKNCFDIIVFFEFSCLNFWETINR